MKKILSCLLFIQVFFFTGAIIKGQSNSCVECHKEMGGKLLAVVEAFANDAHKEAGLSCSDCHGGNQNEEDMDLAKDSTFKGTPNREEITQFCATCHSDFNYIRRYNPSLRVDQMTLYWTSEHGQLLKKGDTRVAICTDCHGTHSIQSASHPKSMTFPWNIPQTCGRCHSNRGYMKGYKISTSQEEEYRESVHANALFEKKDLSAPVCNDCHGNHGAIPPEVTSIANVCRQCHPSTGDLFSVSPHKDAYDEMGISECEACHGNHMILPPTDDMLGTGENAVCNQCHEEDSTSYQVATQIKRKIDGYKENLRHTEELLERAHNRGVEVSEPQFRLIEANTLLIMAKNLTHSLSLDMVEEKIEEGEKLLAEISESGDAAMKESNFRRYGLVIAEIFLLLLAIALFMKIRQISKKTSIDSGSSSR